MSKGYVLKANSKGMGTIYYMNVIMVTEDKECAEVFPNREEAEDNIHRFRCLFHYEENVPIEIEEVDNV